jgi:peroxiredoxin
MAIGVGEQAPGFELKDPNGEVVQLSDFKGTPVLLVFFPFAFTGICEGELCSLRDDYSRFENAGVQVLAVSCDSKNSQKVWSAQLGAPYPILSDFWPHGAAARAYGVFNEVVGCASRISFLIDADGDVADVFGSDDLGTPRESERYEEALGKL